MREAYCVFRKTSVSPHRRLSLYRTPSKPNLNALQQKVMTTILTHTEVKSDIIAEQIRIHKR
jgi:hypothetical protein